MAIAGELNNANEDENELYEEDFETEEIEEEEEFADLTHVMTSINEDEYEFDIEEIYFPPKKPILCG